MRAFKPDPAIWARLRHAGLRQALAILLLLAGVSWAPYQWCSRQAGAWYAGRSDAQGALARGVEQWITADLDRQSFRTGSSQFDGEWLFGTYLMAGFGFAQMALTDPTRRDHDLTLIDRCIDRLQSDAIRAFDRESWNEDPLASLDGPADHAAYLGYFNLLLGLHRALAPDSRHAALNDRISNALARRMAHSPTRMLETYPGETYPVDNCAVFASVALHARITGTDRAGLLDEWRQNFRRLAVDPASGLLMQALHKVSGQALDAPRGSGTTLGLYFLSFADPALSRELYAAARASLLRTVFGFGGMREYPASCAGGRGDIDSGPIVFGFGLSPTGFMLGGSRIHGDPEAFRRLFATAYAWGAPIAVNDRLTYVTGASLGNAILFAMLTALPATNDWLPAPTPQGKIP